MIERSSTRSTLAIMIVTLLLCPTVAFSGFVLNERVWLDRIPQGIYGYYTGEDIRTQATARYFGTPDDPWALIETLSYSSQHNWVQGLEDNYISFPNPTTGQIIRCTKNDINRSAAPTLEVPVERFQSVGI